MEKKVKDLMLSLSVYATVAAESTIQDALRALSKSQLGLTNDRHHHRAVLVLDKQGNVIGKLSHWAILRSLEPRFLKREEVTPLYRTGLTEEYVQSLQEKMTHLTESLSQMCRKAARVKAKDAMVAIVESIDEGASLTSAIRTLVLTHAQSMLVTRDGTVVGILRLTDVFEEIAEQIRNVEGCE